MAENTTPAFGAQQPPTPNAEKQVHQTKKGGLLSTVAILLIIVIMALGINAVLQKNKLNKNIADVEAVIEAQKNETVVVDNKEISLGIKKAFLDKQREDQIFWSNVLLRFQEIEKRSETIEIGSFSGNEQGNISFSAKTNFDSNDPFLDTALLIERFKAASAFTGIFIPSISSAITEQGQETLSYNVRVDYLKGENDQELIEKDTLESSLEAEEPNEEDVEETADTLRSVTDTESQENTDEDTVEESNPDENEE
jgi:hypothetical protein